MTGSHDLFHKVGLLFTADIPLKQTGPHIGDIPGMIALPEGGINERQRLRRMRQKLHTGFDFRHVSSSTAAGRSK